MAPAIHIELDALCLILLCTIAMQSRQSVNQQKDRILFRTTAYGMIVISFVHILIQLVRRDARVPRKDIHKLLKFYLIPVIGSIVSLFQTGMPGTWTCGAVSIVLIYLQDQNREILSGMITAMAADYRSIYHANLDKDECLCVRATGKTRGPGCGDAKLVL